MAAPTLDGSALVDSFSSASSHTITLTTTNTNDVIVVVVSYEVASGSVPTINLPTASGLTFQQRSASGGIAASVGGQQALALFWAPATAALTSKVITVSFASAIDDACIVAFGVNGCSNINSPWDSNASLPLAYGDTTTNSAPSISGASTSQADDFLIFFFGADDTAFSSEAAPSGYTLIQSNRNSGGTNNSEIGVYYKAVSATQSSITVAGGTSISSGWVAGFDALTADAAAAASPFVPYIPWEPTVRISSWVAVRAQTDQQNGGQALLKSTVPDLNSAFDPTSLARTPPWVAIRAQTDQQNGGQLYPSLIFTRLPLITNQRQASPAIAINAQQPQSSIALTTPLVSTPFNQLDWPNPLVKKRLPDGHINFLSLYGQDVFFGTHGQVPTYVQDNPVRATKIPQDFISPSNISSATFAPVIFRTPDINLSILKKPASVVAINSQQPQSSTALLAPPIVQVSITGVSATTSAGIAGAFNGIIPFNQTDWPNPQPPKPHLHEGFIDFMVLNLQDTFFDASGQVPSYVQDNPVLAIKIPQDFISPSNIPLYTYAPTLVFRGPDINLSILKKPSSAVAVSSQDSQQSTNFGVLPFNLPIPGVVATASVGNLAVNIQVPFTNYDFPNPIIPKRGNQYHIDFMVLNMQDTIYDASGQVPQYTWQNDLPVRSNRTEMGMVSSILLSAIGFAYPTSALATTFAGNIVPNVAIGITGVAGTTSVGAISPYLTDNNITGVVATTSAGTVTAQSSTPSLAGVVASTSAGSVSIEVDLPALGVVATTAAGTVNGEVDLPVVGVAATTSVGTVSFGSDLSVGVLGVAGTASAGTVTTTSSANIDISGVYAGVTVGNPLQTVIPTLSGVAATTGAGVVSFAGQVEIAITGVVATTSAGTPTFEADTRFILSGAAATASAGAASIQNITDIFGVGATAFAGTATAEPSGVALGVSASTSAGTVAEIIQKALVGAQVQAEVGSFTETLSQNVTVLGIMATALAGAATVSGIDNDYLFGVEGAEAIAEAGDITITTVSQNIKRIFTNLSIPSIITDVSG